MLDWVIKEELNTHRWDLLNAKIHNNISAGNGATFFHHVVKHTGLLCEFIQTLANKGRNLKFMLQPNREYLSPTVLLMRNNFGPQQYLHKIHNISVISPDIHAIGISKRH